MCDSGGGGGYYVPPDEYNGGGGGGSPSNNQVTGDMQLRVAVNSGLTSARNKLTNSQCSENLFQDMQLNDGTPVANVLTLMNKSSTDWLNSLIWKNGSGIHNSSGSVPCDSGIPAWMSPPGSTTDYVCSPFKNLGASMAGVILIHEELHSLGLSESPQDPNARYTAAQITQAVIDHCGT